MKENFFTYRNIGGGYPAVEEDIRLGTPTAVFGVSEAHKYLLASLVQGKILYITADAVSAGKAFASVSALSGRRCVQLCAKDEVILYKDALSKDALYKRLTAIHAMLNGSVYHLILFRYFRCNYSSFHSSLQLSHAPFLLLFSISDT